MRKGIVRSPEDAAAAGGGADRLAPAPAPRRLMVVGIGASAGGLEALQRFFENMRPDSGMAFVVIQHLSPDHKSLMVELLSKHTTMRVRRVEDEMAVEADTVYLLPPRKNVVSQGERLKLGDRPTGHGVPLPIDIFFSSLAEACGEAAVGVILSGTGSDGMRGVREIKAAGGTLLVQARERWFVMSAAPLQELGGAVVSHVDVTARKQAERELSELRGGDAA